MRLISKLDEYLEDKTYQIIIKEQSINVIHYTEIIDFSTNKITLRCLDKIINIEGQGLIISKMVEEEMMIYGVIRNIRIT